MLTRIKKFFAPIDLTTGTPWKRLLRFAIPVLVSLILTNAFTLINAIVLKTTVGGDSVTAINATTPITNLLFNFAYGCTGGFAVISSNAIGSNDLNKLKKSFHSSIFILCIIALIISILGLTLHRQLIEILNIDLRYYEKSINYIIAILIGFIFAALNYYLSNFLRSIGNSIVPLFLSLLNVILNIALAFLFTGAFNFDTVGAALATIIANLASATICLIYIFSHYPHLRYKHGIDVDLKTSLECLKIGLPLGFQWSILFIGSFLQARVVNQFGEGLATKAVSCYSPIETYISIPFGAISQAVLSFTGQNFGAKNHKRIKQGIKSACIIVGIIYIIVVPIFLVLVPLVPYIFIPREELVGTEGDIIKNYVSTYLYILIPFVICQGITQISRSSLQGIKITIIPLISGIFELIMRISASYLLPSLIDPTNPFSNNAFIGTALSTPLAWLSSALIMGVCVIILIFIKNPLKNLDKNNSNSLDK